MNRKITNNAKKYIRRTDANFTLSTRVIAPAREVSSPQENRRAKEDFLSADIDENSYVRFRRKKEV